MNKNNKVVIIGCGYCGLAAAISLARSGKEVLIVEQNSLPGGKLKSFIHNNWRFNQGFDYISNITKNPKLLNSLTHNKLDFVNQTLIYEKVIFKDGSHYEIVNNRDKFLSKLKNDFPTEITGLVKLFNNIDLISKSMNKIINLKLHSGLTYKLKKVLLSNKINKFDSISLHSLLNKYIKDKKLKSILSIHCEKLLLNPEDLSFSSFCLLKNSYFNGGVIPKGNIDIITETLVKEFKKLGGNIIYNSRVDSINIIKNRAVGITLTDKKIIAGDTVISTIGSLETFSNLITKPKENSINNLLKNRRSFVTLYLGLEGDISKYNIKNGAYRILGKNPFNFDTDPISNSQQPGFISVIFPSILENKKLLDSFNSCQVRVVINNSYLHNKNTSELNKLKEQLRKKLLDNLEKLFPGIEEYIKFTKLLLPDEKNSDGLNFTISNYIDRIEAKNLNTYPRIKGLYLTDIDSIFQGVMGSCYDGVITSSRILKKNLIKNY